MGTLLPNFLLSDVEDEFFFSSGKDAFYYWYDDSLSVEGKDFEYIEFPLLVSGRGFRQNIFIQSDGKLIMI